MSFQQEDEGQPDLHLKLYLEGKGQTQGHGGATGVLEGHGQEPVFEGLNISWPPRDPGGKGHRSSSFSGCDT